MELQPASAELINATRSPSVTEVAPPTNPVSRLPLGERPPMLVTETPARDEALVLDDRSQLTPAQSVEKKISTLVRGGAIPVSHFRLAKLCRKS